LSVVDAGQVKDERIYLDGFEVYRRNGTNPIVRETLHIMDDKKRIALIETRTQGSDPGPQQLIRYHFDNHLGSVSLELDELAQIISYEEYTPNRTNRPDRRLAPKPRRSAVHPPGRSATSLSPRSEGARWRARAWHRDRGE
jgi:hypothetical protein